MKPRANKILYRLIVGFFALFSAGLAISGYVGFVVNRCYFPKETQNDEIALPLFFAVLFLALVIEMFSIRFFP